VNPYNYDNNTLEFKSYLKKENAKSLHYWIEFQSALNTGHSENNMVKAEYYWPKVDGKTPLVILVHGMGDQSIIPCKILAQTLLKQGIACLVLYLTIHSKRIPKVMRDHLPYLTSDEWSQSYQLSVVDIRQVVDWAYNRNELDEKQIVTLGISFGGFVSAIAMGIDTRIKAGVFIVTGGNSAKMNWLSKSRYYRKGYQQTESDYLEIQSSYVKYLTEISEKGFENVTPARESFLTDPLTFASYLKGRPVLMINASWDKYIPKETVIEFWQACGQPPIKWIPSGHASVWLWYPSIRRHIVDFLKSSLSISSEPD